VSAIWAGGVDGGAYFSCKPSQKGEPNFCTVYQDSAGDVYMKGSFVLESEARGARASELQYAFADGDYIYLAHDLILKPVPGQPPLQAGDPPSTNP
jgi:hypothetical protein